MLVRKYNILLQFLLKSMHTYRDSCGFETEEVRSGCGLEVCGAGADKKLQLTQDSISYVLLTKPSLHYLSSLQHHVDIRHTEGL